MNKRRLTNYGNSMPNQSKSPNLFSNGVKCVKLTIKILKGKPSKEDLHKIIDMICEGYKEGIGIPSGINWDLEIDTAAHHHLQKLIDES